jgi:hypothetical protein
MNGTSQELTTSASGGRLVIRDLLVRDYPRFIRITGWEPTTSRGGAPTIKGVWTVAPADRTGPIACG